MAASSSTAAHSNNSQWYEIFINHRGVDVKKTFAKSLYNRLRSIELKAFLDEDVLQRGYEFPSQIKRAIETASAHVAIFSPRYAESNWCLDELVLMLDSGVPTIPVFYGVTPAEVRWAGSKRGRYAQALQILAEKRTSDPQTNQEKPRFDSKTVEDWRNALFRVADISGFELEACNIGKELEMELLDVEFTFSAAQYRRQPPSNSGCRTLCKPPTIFVCRTLKPLTILNVQSTSVLHSETEEFNVGTRI